MTKHLLGGFLALALAFGTAGSALAAGSSSSSTPKSSAYDDGVAAVKSGDFKRAISLFQKVVAKDSRNADAWNWIGFSQRNLGHFDRSLAAYEKALAIDPGHRGALEYLGELYLQTGKLDKARAQLERLDKACLLGCEEFDDLKKAIKRYASNQG